MSGLVLDVRLEIAFPPEFMVLLQSLGWLGNAVMRPAETVVQTCEDVVLMDVAQAAPQEAAPQESMPREETLVPGEWSVGEVDGLIAVVNAKKNLSAYARTLGRSPASAHAKVQKLREAGRLRQADLHPPRAAVEPSPAPTPEPVRVPRTRDGSVSLAQLSEARAPGFEPIDLEALIDWAEANGMETGCTSKQLVVRVNAKRERLGLPQWVLGETYGGYGKLPNSHRIVPPKRAAYGKR